MKDLKETFCYYVRVSSKQQEQKRTYENQITAIEKYAEKKNLLLSDEYKDVMTGTKYDRPAFIKMMRKLIDYKGMIVSFIDRLGRDFVEQMRVFAELHKTGVDIHVVDFGELDWDSLDDQFKYVIESYFGAKESERHVQRVKAGIARKRRENNGQWGRKPKDIDWIKYDACVKAGLNKTEIAKALSISRTTLHTKLKEREKDL